MIPRPIPSHDKAGTGITGPRFAMTAKLRATGCIPLEKVQKHFSMLNIPAAFQSPHQRGVVRKLQMSAHGDAIGQAGHPDAEGL